MVAGKDGRSSRPLGGWPVPTRPELGSIPRRGAMKGVLHLMILDVDELVEALLDDMLAGLDQRLAFERWADERERQ